MLNGSDLIQIKPNPIIMSNSKVLFDLKTKSAIIITKSDIIKII